MPKNFHAAAPSIEVRRPQIAAWAAGTTDEAAERAARVYGQAGDHLTARAIREARYGWGSKDITQPKTKA